MNASPARAAGPIRLEPAELARHAAPQEPQVSTIEADDKKLRKIYAQKPRRPRPLTLAPQYGERCAGWAVQGYYGG